MTNKIFRWPQCHLRAQHPTPSASTLPTCLSALPSTAAISLSIPTLPTVAPVFTESTHQKRTNTATFNTFNGTKIKKDKGENHPNGQLIITAYKLSFEQLLRARKGAQVQLVRALGGRVTGKKEPRRYNSAFLPRAAPSARVHILEAERIYNKHAAQSNRLPTRCACCWDCYFLRPYNLWTWSKVIFQRMGGFCWCVGKVDKSL